MAAHSLPPQSFGGNLHEHVLLQWSVLRDKTLASIISGSDDYKFNYSNSDNSKSDNS